MDREGLNEHAQPIVDLYTLLEMDMLENIAKSLDGHKDILESDPEAWQLQKLQNLGFLTKENLKIVKKKANLTSAEMNGILYSAGLEGLSKDEEAIKKAIKEGAHLKTPPPVAENPKILDILSAYSNQAMDVLNLTNTTMLSQANQVYKNILNMTVLDALSGNLTGEASLRKAIKMFATTGIPALIDKAGKHWGVEGYTRMVMVTTNNNVTNQMQDERFDEYGISQVEISSHIGARPKCAPYQGRVFTIKGKASKHYPSIKKTSLGEADGLFGINCGHVKYPFIPGISKQRYTPYNAEQNKKQYEESQKQRSIERSIRKAKTQHRMLKAAGDEEGAKQAKQTISKRQLAMRDFIAETGRTRRPSREGIVDISNPTPIPKPPKNMPAIPKKPKTKVIDKPVIKKPVEKKVEVPKKVVPKVDVKPEIKPKPKSTAKPKPKKSAVKITTKGNVDKNTLVTLDEISKVVNNAASKLPESKIADIEVVVVPKHSDLPNYAASNVPGQFNKEDGKIYIVADTFKNGDKTKLSFDDIVKHNKNAESKGSDAIDKTYMRQAKVDGKQVTQYDYENFITNSVGHSLFDVGEKYNDEAIKIFNKLNDGDLNKTFRFMKEKVSKISGANAKEAIPEMFALYMRDDYKKGYLPKEFEDLFDEVLKDKSVKAKTNNSKVGNTHTKVDVSKYKMLDQENINVSLDAETLQSMPDHADAVRRYTGSDYQAINKFLREGGDMYDGSPKADEILKIYDIINDFAAPLEEDEIFTRFMAGNAAKDLFGSEINYLIQKTLEDPSEKKKDVMRRKLEDATIVDKAFVSTSRGENTAFLQHNGLEVKIYAPKGSKTGMFVESVSKYYHEKEYVINAGQKLQVFDVDVSQRGSKKNIVLKVRPIN